MVDMQPVILSGHVAKSSPASAEQHVCEALWSGGDWTACGLGGRGWRLGIQLGRGVGLVGQLFSAPYIMPPMARLMKDPIRV